MKSKNLTVMLIEICGKGTRTQAAGPSPYFDYLTRVQDLILSVVEKYEGTVVKKVSGALLVVFESPTVAVKAGMELQRRNREEEKLVFSDARIEVKVAINSGEIAVSHDDAYGEAVSLLQDLQKIIDPGQVIFTEATCLSMSKSHVPEAEVGYYKIGNSVNRIKVYKIRDEEISVARISGRSLSYFGLLRHDPSNRPYKVFPAPTGRRVIAGVLEFWIGLFLMVGFSVLCRLPQIWGLWTDVVRIQAENFSSEGSAPEMIPGNWGFMGSGALFTGDQTLKVVFPGPSGRYYIESAFGFKEGIKGFPGVVFVVIGDAKFPYQGSFGGRENSQIEELGGPVQVDKGQEIRIIGSLAPLPEGTRDIADSERKMNIAITVDYLEFVREGSWAYRPKGWEQGYKYLDFYRAINYDDMNFHFFIGPLPLWIFLHLFLVQALFSRTLGGIIMGLHIQTEKTNEKIGARTAFLRTVCWFLVPLWGWTAIGKEHQWTDVVSNSRVVVFRD